MKERPIIFSGPMVKAVLAGRKTQTRRIVKGKWISLVEQVLMVNGKRVFDTLEYDLTTPYGILDDRLWVKETFRISESSCNDYSPSKDDVHYRADDDECGGGPWKPAIYMHRHLSRLTLEIIDVRVQRLQEITEEDVKAEGAMFHNGGEIGHSGWRHDFKDVHSNARSSFGRLWNSIHGEDAWNENPWVWAITFKKLCPPTAK